MPRPLRTEFPGAIWHVTSRGNERKDIVRDDADRRRFVRFLARTIDDHSLIVHAWVLMSNHYHLLVQTPVIGLSDALKALNERVAQTFNERYGRVGHLFQSRPKIKLVKREAHLLELVRYVVLNPVRAGMVRFPGEYVWSNYRATAGMRPAPAWLETAWTLRQFHPTDAIAAREEYRKFVGLARGAAYDPWESFRLEELQEIAEAVCSEFEVSLEELRSPRRRLPTPRSAFVHLGASATESGAWLGISTSAASKLRRIALELNATDPAYRRCLEAVRAVLSSKKGSDPKTELSGFG